VTPSVTKKRKTVMANPISFIDSLESKEAPLSPQIACWSVEECHNQIVNRFAQKGTNFLCAINLLRRMHQNYDGIRLCGSTTTTGGDMITVTEEVPGWLYPCRSTSNANNCGSYVVVRRRGKDGVQQFCSVCLSDQRTVDKKDVRRQQRSQTATRTSSSSATRRAPVDALNMAELQGALKAQSMVMKRKNQANKRLKEHLEVRSPTVTLRTVTEASDVLKQVFNFISSKRQDATQLILNALIDFEVGDGLQSVLLAIWAVETNGSLHH
jgi:hypothetical protein